MNLKRISLIKTVLIVIIISLIEGYTCQLLDKTPIVVDALVANDPHFFHFDLGSTPSKFDVVVETCGEGSINMYMSQATNSPSESSHEIKSTTDSSTGLALVSKSSATGNVTVAVVPQSSQITFRITLTLNSNPYVRVIDSSYYSSGSSDIGLSINGTMIPVSTYAVKGPVENWNTFVPTVYTPCALAKHYTPVTFERQDYSNGSLVIFQGLKNNSSYVLNLVLKDSDGLEYVISPDEYKTRVSSSCKVMTDSKFCGPNGKSVYVANPGDTVESLDALASQSYNNFTTILYQYNCESLKYSYVVGCSNCTEAYKKWICAVIFPTCSSTPQGKGRTGDVAYTELICDQVCYNVLQSCPTFLNFNCPVDKTTLSYQYTYRDCNSSSSLIISSLLILLLVSVQLLF